MTGSRIKIKDMTVGNPTRMIIEFAVPLLIGNIFQQIYSVVDTMVAGYNLGDNAIAAIGATMSLFGVIINIAFGMNGGFALVVTRCFGAHRDDELRKSIAGMLTLDLIISLALTGLAMMFLRPLMHFMNTPDVIFNEAYSYMSVLCMGIIATMAYNMFSSILRAVGNSVIPLVALIIACVLNIILDIVFIALMHMGVGGAALATIIAQTISAVFAGTYFYRNYKEMLPKREDFRMERDRTLELLSNGSAMAFMFTVIDIGGVFFQAANNSLGEVIIASQTAGRRIVNILMTPLGSISSAASTFVGQNWGAGKGSRIKTGIRQACLIEVAWGLIACALGFLFGRYAIIFTTGTNNPEIIKNAVMCIRIHVPLFWVLGILFVMRNSMQAIGKKTIPVMSSIIELLMKLMAAAILIPKLGYLGTCITEPTTWILMTLLLLGGYFTYRKTLLADN
ncbi:MAG: MATE family efflux transporter [Oscillospiraceae bacterium]|nr:MATE family efflux transporter [Oscillospiraceae bacterium]